jgi:hypothetical protein
VNPQSFICPCSPDIRLRLSEKVWLLKLKLVQGLKRSFTSEKTVDFELDWVEALVQRASPPLREMLFSLRNGDLIPWDSRLGCPRAGKIPALQKLDVPKS